MKLNHAKTSRTGSITLGDVIETVGRLTKDDRLVALVVADMINTRRVRLEGLHGKRVVVTQ